MFAAAGADSLAREPVSALRLGDASGCPPFLGMKGACAPPSSSADWRNLKRGATLNLLRLAHSFSAVGRGESQALRAMPVSIELSASWAFGLIPLTRSWWLVCTCRGQGTGDSTEAGSDARYRLTAR
jgi:hypothetical protein